MDKLRLEVPAKAHELRAREYIDEFYQYQSQINGSGGLDRGVGYDEWLRKLESYLDEEHVPENWVPAETYFLVRESDDRIVGMINIRRRLNDFLFERGGHIGYGVRPTERRKGCATEMLRLGLERCRELGLAKVLITCNKDNIASAKTIRRGGGILENEVTDAETGEIVQRYWITL